jgi:hypothetical protein
MAPKKTKEESEKITVTPNDLEWTDHVLTLLSDDEKIAGNPTTDGLRRVFEIALNCTVVESTSKVVQSPDQNNEKRATVVHTIGYVLNTDMSTTGHLNTRVVSGAADVYWGNCDKVYRNHPVAVAETRAEGRALRRGLKLRKVVAAEEIAKEIDDDIHGGNINKINNNQINFIDVISKRLDIDVSKLLEEMTIDSSKIYAIEHDKAIEIVQKLTAYQQDMTTIPDGIKSYNPSWK